MYATKLAILSYFIAFTSARFGQEQVPVSAISSLSSFGSPGQAATLAGSVPGVLLAAANPCAKLQLADKIVQTLGNNTQVISAAQQLVAAERNFNPFNVNVDSFCASTDLPATEALRGIVPLVDPAVVGSDTENANSKTSLTSPFDATGKSVAEVAIAQGFSNFTAVDSTGNKVNLAGLSSASSSGSTGNKNSGNSGSATSVSSGKSVSATTLLTATRAATSTSSCTPTTVTVTVTPSAAASNSGNTNNNVVASGSASSTSTAASSTGTGSASSGTVAGKGAGEGVTTSISGADFGSCNPTIRREGGLNGRKATEFTFQANDPKIEAIQQEALNPNIITNRICDELTNQCGANDQAKSVCQDAKAKVLAIGSPADRSDSTVDVWNSALGF